MQQEVGSSDPEERVAMEDFHLLHREFDTGDLRVRSVEKKRERSGKRKERQESLFIVSAPGNTLLLHHASAPSAILSSLSLSLSSPCIQRNTINSVASFFSWCLIRFSFKCYQAELFFSKRQQRLHLIHCHVCCCSPSTS